MKTSGHLALALPLPVARIGRQAGLTLIELLVALAVSMVVTVAAVAALAAGLRGFSGVDSASQLRDNARFAVNLIQRVGVQTGYKDIAYAATPRPSNVSGVSANPDPAVFGFNNATPSVADPSHAATARTGGPGFGSDVLVLRYQSPETFPGSGVVDQSVIDCMGRPSSSTAVPKDRDSAMTSILHVAVNNGEPALMCTTIDSAGVISAPRPLISGVENFQVLYGVDGVTTGAAPTILPDSIADSLLRADQLDVPSDTVGTNKNWRRVRSLRIGMVLRGARGSAADRVAQTFYPLGQTMWASTDEQTKYQPAPDGRLRHVVTFTVHLRNEQGL